MSNDIPSRDNALYPTPERVAEASAILASEWLAGEVLHPAVKANCQQVLDYAKLQGRNPYEVRQ